MTYLAAAITVVLSYATPRYPELRPIEQGRYMATNPLRYPIEMRISCGDDFTQPSIPLPARSREEVTITLPNGSPAGACFLDSYKAAK